MNAIKPEPKVETLQEQIAEGVEEIAQMLLCLSTEDEKTETLLHNAYLALHLLAVHLKESDTDLEVRTPS